MTVIARTQSEAKSTKQSHRNCWEIASVEDSLAMTNYFLADCCCSNPFIISSSDLLAITKACKDMSETRTGALIILAAGNDLNFYIKTGEQLDAKVSANTLESIFYKNSPLHDGAVIISNGKIRAARCVLPITEREDFPSHLGMRHRAAAGITEASDAIAIIVSEQTGEISLCKGGHLENGIGAEKLKQRIEKEMI